jgi:hypothetical protein
MQLDTGVLAGGMMEVVVEEEEKDLFWLQNLLQQ